ncbi:MAG TPA: sigma-54 dependent transcriptional regulator [Planctomycetota bacterium]|nr:sigma-54 dependent transcriptional regulator [Planctomycetota bacterium]
MSKVLIVDDEPAMVKVLSGFLSQEKIEWASASSGEQALRVLHAEDIGVIVTDLKMTGMDGLQLLEHALNIDRSLQVILITAHGTSEIGQRAWELGAAGYVRKPFDRDEILFEIRRSLDKVKAGAEVADAPGQMVGQSAPMKDVYAMVSKVAPTSSTVLIRGESGTGKELVARAVHDQSKRKGKAFIKVICAALPETLIESELFGYEKGAFTGAAASKPGRFELAEGGTIFLDEIGELSPATQVKLLRVLQDRQFERIGGITMLRADVRVLAATHRDLEALVKEGKFREDLFYRINVVPIRMPALRERPADIPLLVEHFMKRLRQEHGKPSVKFDGKAVDALAGHSWPGNVRELQNVVERLVVLNTSGLILEQEVRPCLAPRLTESASAGPVALGASVAGAEKSAIEAALKSSGGNRTHAAKALGISRRTLHNKLNEYGIF